MSASPISNVSDTARWVAVYRARESARSDALFHDPYAELLAGERGHEIAALMPRQARNGWPMIARTKLMDDLVLATVEQGCDCVMNLAAGFDTRPYRLELPSSLRWIEADLPALIEEKERLLKDALPRCQLRRIKVDLTDASARVAMFQEAVGSAAQVLVITEGLLLYLDEAQVRSLTLDLGAQAGIRWWILDLASPKLLQMMKRSMGSRLANAPMKFGPPNGVAFFEELGWRVTHVQSVLRAAARFRRLPWTLKFFAFLPEADPRKPGRAPWSAVVQLGRG
ncbi:MAG: SAM-dependent methyltransferase [Pseudomonadota bacterium]|nr:SAM-dependent methyltransferase [Pseudomonadota bacterium]